MAEQKRKMTTEKTETADPGKPMGENEAANTKMSTQMDRTSPMDRTSRQMSGMKEGNGNGEALIHQMRTTAAEAYDSAKIKAAEKLEEQKHTLSGGLSKVADNFRKLGENFDEGEADGVSRVAAEYSQIAANRLEQAVGYFDRKDLNVIYGDVEDLVRRNPGWFVAGAFVFGFVAARFLKSANAETFDPDGGAYRHDLSGQRNRSSVGIAV